MARRSLWSLTVCAVLVTACHANAPANEFAIVPHVDQRVELLSVVFRLAGNFEYNMSPLSSYTGDIDTYFAAYRNHPAVAMARRVVQTRGVHFDAVMKMAVDLSDAPKLSPVVPFTEEIPDPRWGKENAMKFVPLLQDFYRDTHFEKFFAAHRALYELAESRFQKVLNAFDVDWYKNFYGEMPKGQFHVFLGMNNGGGSYGPHVDFPDGRTEVFAIIGTGRKDDVGDPVFAADDLSTIVHEFNHSFIGPLLARDRGEFASAEKVYQPVAGKLRALAYGDAQTMVEESLVRAAVILYFESKGETRQLIEKRIIGEQALGFVWMDDLCELLQHYESQRNRYPTLGAFMGVIADFYNGLANRIGAKLAAFHAKCVHVTAILPFANHSQDVDASTTEMTVTFDKALNPKRYSITYGAEGSDHFPLVGNIEFSADNRSIKLHLQLKPNWSYGLVLSAMAFATEDGYPLEDYPVDFKTK
jgi:hypothetical protein